MDELNVEKVCPTCHQNSKFTFWSLGSKSTSVDPNWHLSGIKCPYCYWSDQERKRGLNPEATKEHLLDILHQMDKDSQNREVKQLTKQVLNGEIKLVENLLIEIKKIYLAAKQSQSGSVKSILTMMNIAKREVDDFRTCYDCFVSRHSTDPGWFTVPCSSPHILVYAQVRSYPFWPGKVRKRVGTSNKVVVKFFGDHNYAIVPSESCYLMSNEYPRNIKPTNEDFKDAERELKVHLDKLAKQFPGFNFLAPVQTKLDPSHLHYAVARTLTTRSDSGYYSDESLLSPMSDPISESTSVVEPSDAESEIVMTDDDSDVIIFDDDSDVIIFDDEDGNVDDDGSVEEDSGLTKMEIEEIINKQPVVLLHRCEILEELSKFRANMLKLTSMLTKLADSSIKEGQPEAQAEMASQCEAPVQPLVTDNGQTETGSRGISNGDY